MKILMIGRGAISTLYGWALAKAGHTVHYYVRPGRAAQYSPTVQLDLLDARTRLQGVRVMGTLSTPLVEDLNADHAYDLIVVSVQHYRFAEVMSFLAERVGSATVLMFNNLWVGPESAASALNADQLVWGFPRAGGGFGPGGVLRGSLLKNVIFGDLGAGADSSRGRTVRELFRGSGFGIQEQRDFRGWLSVHFLINAGLLPQALKAGSFAKLMSSDAHLRQAVLNVRELLPILSARGIDLKLHAADVAPFRLPPGLVSLLLRLAFRFSQPVGRVTAALPGEALRQEVRPMTLDVLSEARRLGVAVPRLEAFSASLEETPTPPTSAQVLTSV
ncbi:2-dehydropantoate 2-reductase N-terminal domain-containing protein [Deinococcus sp.]|uniref:ketopantoate reductase family protein n=1 Tax=Deinococcus sp. TaxID=47478 RepID=UPI0025FFE56D|nr:2-dehydropantoate 2-reductase N-terminal domain-containing protein [Deinococcus sp.]